MDDKKYDRRYGTRSEVWDGTAEKTRGGLTRDKLMLSRTGRLVSKLKSEQARTAYQKFGFVKRAQPGAKEDKEAEEAQAQAQATVAKEMAAKKKKPKRRRNKKAKKKAE
jgi:hypothetical protein